jgi:hypothetical protein
MEQETLEHCQGKNSLRAWEDTVLLPFVSSPSGGGVEGSLGNKRVHRSSTGHEGDPMAEVLHGSRTAL